MQIKAIITDLDRTLLHTDKTISPYTLEVFRACKEKGIVLLAATARPERAIEEYCKQIPFDEVTVTNGARVLLPGKELQYGISHESGEAIIAEFMKVPDLILSVEMSTGLYSNVNIPEWMPIIHNGFPKLPSDGVLYKVLASSVNPRLYNMVEGVMREDTYYSIANNTLIQVMSKEATKWNGVRTMLEALKIPAECAVYFGDDNDDVESIRKCGMGVAVSNAIPEVLAAADYIARSNDEDGVARFVEENVL